VSQEHLGLFDTPPARPQVRFCLAIVGVLIIGFLLILPVSNARLPEVDAFIPTIDAVMFLGELITATMLYAQAAVFRSRALAVLGTGYIFTALLIVPHALTFPGAFAPSGLLGAGLNTTAWITIFRRAGFPIAIILYVLLKRADSASAPGTEPKAPRIGLQILAAVALAAAATTLGTVGRDLLPPFYLNHADLIYANALGYECLLFALLVAATVMLFRQRDSVLDMWLLVSFSGWLIQSLLIMTLHGRFTAGWYGLYVLMLFTQLVVMLALIAESNRLYARLALSTSAWNREREARLMSIDAMAATISHEVGQPLFAVSTHASAGLKWLTRERPDVERAIKSLRATIEAGRHTTEVIKSIRAMFAKRPGIRIEFSLNDLVRTTASSLGMELAGEKVSLQLVLEETLPPILADRVQVQRVLVNLLTNAIESLAITRGRPRRVTIRTSPLGHDVLLEVSDNGAGIAPEDLERIFDAFFTTKETGTGLGLSLCRTIIEAHGGRLWASHGEEQGASFHLQLPSSGSPEGFQADGPVLVGVLDE
jgi:signal transduction histidine kinase